MDEITQIFAENKIKDLKKFMKKRSELNKCNTILIYLFHILQTSGIFITTFSTSNSQYQYIWLGIALNLLASLINVIEKTNRNISQQLMTDIVKIKNNRYIDESEIIDTNKIQSTNTNTIQNKLEDSV